MHFMTMTHNTCMLLKAQVTENSWTDVNKPDVFMMIFIHLFVILFILPAGTFHRCSPQKNPNTRNVMQHITSLSALKL